MRPTDTPPRVIEIKAWPRYFRAVADGSKPFEVRQDDRGYAEGDTLLIREWDPNRCVFMPRGSAVSCSCTQHFTGREVTATVTYVLPGGQFGIAPDAVVLGIALKETP